MSFIKYGDLTQQWGLSNEQEVLEMFVLFYSFYDSQTQLNRKITMNDFHSLRNKITKIESSTRPLLKAFFTLFVHSSATLLSKFKLHIYPSASSILKLSLFSTLILPSVTGVRHARNSQWQFPKDHKKNWHQHLSFRTRPVWPFVTLHIEFDMIYSKDL